MTYEVSYKDMETGKIYKYQTFETREDAETAIEELEDADLETADYERYEYFINGEPATD